MSDKTYVVVFRGVDETKKDVNQWPLLCHLQILTRLNS